MHWYQSPGTTSQCSLYFYCLLAGRRVPFILSLHSCPWCKSCYPWLFGSRHLPRANWKSRGGVAVGSGEFSPWEASERNHLCSEIANQAILCRPSQGVVQNIWHLECSCITSASRLRADAAQMTSICPASFILLFRDSTLHAVSRTLIMMKNGVNGVGRMAVRGGSRRRQQGPCVPYPCSNLIMWGIYQRPVAHASPCPCHLLTWEIPLSMEDCRRITRCITLLQ